MIKLRNMVLAVAIFCGFAATASAEQTLGIHCYNTNYGLLHLVFIPNKVLGVYAYGGGGVVVGDLDGRTLKATWSEPKATKYSQAGDAEFEFSDDWSSFKGRYKFSNKDTWDKWDGKETSCPGGDSSANQSSGHDHNH